MEEQFWIIWSPTSDKPPRKKFLSEAQAMKVIEEMAKGNAGHDFYAMEVIGHARLDKPIVTSMRKKEGSDDVLSGRLRKAMEDDRKLSIGTQPTPGHAPYAPDDPRKYTGRIDIVTPPTIETTAQQQHEPPKDRPGKISDLLGTKMPGTFGFPFGSSIDSDARKSVTVFVNTLADWARDGAPMCDRCGSRAADLQGSPSGITARCRSCGKYTTIHPISKDKK